MIRFFRHLVAGCAPFHKFILRLCLSLLRVRQKTRKVQRLTLKHQVLDRSIFGLFEGFIKVITAIGLTR